MILPETPTLTAQISPLDGAHHAGYFRYGAVDPTEESIVSGLSRECRFSGQTPEPWTVIQHSVLVYTLADLCLPLYNSLSPLFADKQHSTPLWKPLIVALLHDAPEAYYKDIPWPMKQWIKTLPHGPEVLQAIEEAHAQCLTAILRKFFDFDVTSGFSSFPDAEFAENEMGKFIKDMDILALHFERRWFFPKSNALWSQTWHVDEYMKQDRMLDALHETLPHIHRRKFSADWCLKKFCEVWLTFVKGK